MSVYNPIEVKIKMRKIESGDKHYFIGNSDMDVGLLDTVIKFFPPTDDQRYGALVINNTKEREEIESEDKK